MHAGLKFSLELVDGERLGKLAVPHTQMACWLNFLTAPHYGAQIIFAEQGCDGVTIYFDACEGMYGYLSDRINGDRTVYHSDPARLPLAS